MSLVCNANRERKANPGAQASMSLLLKKAIIRHRAESAAFPKLG
jgi:hypothetical protein